MTELTLEESIQQILPTLPLPIQKFFEQHKLGETARLLMERYALHIDQGTILERELMFILLGLKSPDEFAADLYEQLPVSEQTTRDIITDINKEVFVPLREEEMKNGGTKIERSTKPVESEKIVTPPVMPRPITVPTPSSAEPSEYFHLENKIPSPPPPTSSPRPPVVVVPKPVVREENQASLKPVENEKLLEDHEESHIEFSTPARTVPPPPNLPGAMPPPIISKVESVTLPIQPHPPLKAAEGAAKPIPPVSSRPYSVDPYREPIDEK